jgi:Asp-tRNA(Asn)/Glu-tRNA(Gln) amidotransferase A subunit family amidase
MTNGIHPSRRQFLQRVSAAAVVTAVRPVAGTTSNPSDAASILELSATEAVTSMTRGEIPAERYAAVLLERCKVGKSLNAFISLEPERVLEAARECDVRRRTGAKLGPLHGLPIPIKDSINTKDYPTTAGTPALKDFRPTEDAPIVSIIRQAGGVVLGKTNLHELSYGYTSNNPTFGAVHNPYDPTRIPGGSSGGTAAAVAAQMAPLGVAEDTEGSIRVPAALCGIAGFRPSTGRYPTEGSVPTTALFDQLGPEARSVADLALFDSAVTGDASRLLPASLKGLRLGVVRSYWYTNLDPQVERATALALTRLKDAGVTLIESDLSALPGLARTIELVTDPICYYDSSRSLAQYLKKYNAGISFDQLIAQANPDLQEIFKAYVMPGAPHGISDAKYREARDVHLPALRQSLHHYFAITGVAAIVFPASGIPAPRIGQLEVPIKGRSVSIDDIFSHTVAPCSTAGLPGLVIPTARTTSGLPTALEFDGPRGSDRALLAVGLSMENLFGRLPPPVI